MTISCNPSKVFGKCESLEVDPTKSREFGRELTNGGTLIGCTSLQSSAQGKPKLQNLDPEPKTLCPSKIVSVKTKEFNVVQQGATILTSRNEKHSSLNSTHSNGNQPAFGPNKHNSSFQQSQQPLKRCKSNSSNNSLVAKTAKELEPLKPIKTTVRVNKQKKGLPLTCKVPVKPQEPEAEQLKVFVDQETETGSKDASHDANEEVLSELSAAFVQNSTKNGKKS